MEGDNGSQFVESDVPGPNNGYRRVRLGTPDSCDGMGTNAAEGVLQRKGSDMVSNERKNRLQIDL